MKKQNRKRLKVGTGGATTTGICSTEGYSASQKKKRVAFNAKGKDKPQMKQSAASSQLNGRESINSRSDEEEGEEVSSKKVAAVKGKQKKTLAINKQKNATLAAPTAPGRRGRQKSEAPTVNIRGAGGSSTRGNSDKQDDECDLGQVNSIGNGQHDNDDDDDEKKEAKNNNENIKELFTLEQRKKVDGRLLMLMEAWQPTHKKQQFKCRTDKCALLLTSPSGYTLAQHASQCYFVDRLNQRPTIQELMASMQSHGYHLKDNSDVSLYSMGVALRKDLQKSILRQEQEQARYRQEKDRKQREYQAERQKRKDEEAQARAAWAASEQLKQQSEVQQEELLVKEQKEVKETDQVNQKADSISNSTSIGTPLPLATTAARDSTTLITPTSCSSSFFSDSSTTTTSNLTTTTTRTTVTPNSSQQCLKNGKIQEEEEVEKDQNMQEQAKSIQQQEQHQPNLNEEEEEDLKEGMAQEKQQQVMPPPLPPPSTHQVETSLTRLMNSGPSVSQFDTRVEEQLQQEKPPPPMSQQLPEPVSTSQSAIATNGACGTNKSAQLINQELNQVVLKSAIDAVDKAKVVLKEQLEITSREEEEKKKKKQPEESKKQEVLEQQQQQQQQQQQERGQLQQDDKKMAAQEEEGEDVMQKQKNPTITKTKEELQHYIYSQEMQQQAFIQSLHAAREVEAKNEANLLECISFCEDSEYEAETELIETEGNITTVSNVCVMLQNHIELLQSHMGQLHEQLKKREAKKQQLQQKLVKCQEIKLSSYNSFCDHMKASTQLKRRKFEEFMQQTNPGQLEPINKQQERLQQVVANQRPVIQGGTPTATTQVSTQQEDDRSLRMMPPPDNRHSNKLGDKHPSSFKGNKSQTLSNSNMGNTNARQELLLTKQNK